MKQIIIFLLLLPFATSLFAQATFVTKGKIEFEKRENLYKNLESWGGDDDEGEDAFVASIKKSMPQFSSTYFDLYFDESHTLYKPGREVNGQKIPEWFQSPANGNVVYNDMAKQQLTLQKNFYGTTMLLQDSARHIDWRITNDLRTIAGFECRKAVGRIMDSVYVIAFYTDQIVTPGGPESFSGLPGMILGIGIPRINTTWYATKLEVTPVTEADIAPPSKGKKFTAGEFQKKLNEVMKDWGKYGKRKLLQVLI